jgi:hypothetical protein
VTVILATANGGEQKLTAYSATARRTAIAIARKAMGRSPSNQMGSITVGTTRGRMGFQKPICR